MIDPAQRPAAETPNAWRKRAISIEFDLAGRPVVTRRQPAIIVEQHLVGDPAKMAERALDTGKPALLALVAERPDIEPPRVTQRGHNQAHLDVLVVD